MEMLDFEGLGNPNPSALNEYSEKHWRVRTRIILLEQEQTCDNIYYSELISHMNA